MRFYFSPSSLQFQPPVSLITSCHGFTSRSRQKVKHKPSRQKRKSLDSGYSPASLHQASCNPIGPHKAVTFK